MKNYTKFYFILGIILIIFISTFLLKDIIFKPEKPPVENDEIKLLKQIFPEKLIISQNDKDHYFVDGKDYYVKSLGDVNRDGFSEFVSMEIIPGEGKTYKFYTKTLNDYFFIGEEATLIWHLEDNKNKEMEITLKDITGDGINEFIVRLAQSASNTTVYRILAFDDANKKLIIIPNKDYFSKKPETSIIFDEIRRENNFVVTIGHGGYNKTKSYYSINGNILNFERSIGVYGEPGVEEYEYREIDKDGNIIYKEKRRGNFWLDESVK